MSDAVATIDQTNLPFPKRSGKVRDCYDMGENLLIVSTDRISAFDFILQPAIPNKGRILTLLSKFWFSRISCPHHFLTDDIPESVATVVEINSLQGRCMLVKKAKVIPFECVVRGYLEGSGWREYQSSGEICGVRLPTGLLQCSKLPEPIFTPATKVDEGHDENVSFETMVASIGRQTAETLRTKAIDTYIQAAEYAATRGIIIADTKFEFGWCDEGIILIDEVLTPDSSRFWDAEKFEPGRPQASFDKQFVREYLMSLDWDRKTPPPPLPPNIVQATAELYQKAFERLTV